MDHAAAIVTPVQETFTEALEFTSEFTPRAFPNLIKHLEPTWVEEALASTGTASMRRRRLPAEHAVWLVIGMAVMRDKPITAVAQDLDLALPATDGTRTVASSALTQARARLGDAPMEWLFLRSAEEWAHRSAAADSWRGLGLYASAITPKPASRDRLKTGHFGRSGTVVPYFESESFGKLAA